MHNVETRCSGHRAYRRLVTLLGLVAPSTMAIVCLSAPGAHAKDNFQCYQAAIAAHEAKLVTPAVQLVDLVESKLTAVTKRTRVCDRASVASEGVFDPVANWTCYGIQQAKNEAKFVRRDVHVRDRFGVHAYSLVKASQMCVTSERDLAGVPAPLDDLKCYKVATAKGATKFAATDVSVQDQLDGSKLTTVKKPSMICGPVDRDGLGTVDPGEHWMCYQIADAKTVPPQTKFAAVDVSVGNLFEGADPRAMTVKKPGELCVPASAHLEGVNGVAGPQFCDANHDCSAGLYCARSGVCAPDGSGVVGDACASGADCDDALYCDLRGIPGTCAAAGSGATGAACTLTGDCAAGLVCSAAGACRPSSVAYPDYAGVSCGTDDSAFRGYFQVPRAGTPLQDFYRLPFPNDVRVQADGTLDLSDFPRPGPSLIGVDIVDLYADALGAGFDGFSSTAAVSFRFSKEVNFDTAGSGAAIHYVDITPGALEYGTERSHSESYEEGRGLYRCQHALSIRDASGDPLLSGHTYAVYLTNSIASAHGEFPTQASDFAALLSVSPPADADLTAAWTSYQAFRDYLASSSISPATIAVGTSFTVQDSTSDMVSLRTAVESSPLPVLSDLTICDGIAVSPCDDGGVRVCGTPQPDFDEIHGRFSIPIYQAGTNPYETPADGGGILFDAGGAPIQQGTANVCFALTVPKTTPPSGGWPLVVHAHGTGGSFRAAITDGIAHALAAAATPMATLTFDGIAHGARRGASVRNPESLVFNVVNPRAARDNHLQGAVDVIQVLRIAQTAPTIGPLVISLDASKTYYFGHSQGSNVGIPALATSNLAKAAVLSGAGSVLTEGLLSRTSPVNVKAGLEVILGEPLSSVHPLITLIETWAGRSDSINYAPLLLRRPPSGVDAKHVFLSWGSGDTFAPTSLLGELASATGLPVASPLLENIGTGTATRPVSNNLVTADGTNRTAALFQYAPDGAYDGDVVALRNAAAIADWTAFLSSAASTGTPTVP